MNDVLYIAALVAAAFVIRWARGVEARMPQCDVCGPMYFGEHHDECPKRGQPPDANYA